MISGFVLGRGWKGGMRIRLALFMLLMIAACVSSRAADLEFVTQELPWAVIDKPYSLGPLQVRSSGACPLGGVGYSVVGGALPPGVQMSKLGYFSGSPERTGVFGFAIRVSDGCTWLAQRFTLTVTGAPVITMSPGPLVFDGPGEKLVHISATWPKLSYAATADADWIRIRPAHGFTPRPTSALVADDILVSVDPATLKPGHYSALITVSAWQALGAPTISVEFNVREKSVPSGIPTNVAPR
jgi:hypothetical protein